MKKIFILLLLFFCELTIVYSQSTTPFCFGPTPSDYTYPFAVAQDISKGLNSFDIDNDGKTDLVYPSLGLLRRRLGLGNGLFAAAATTISTSGVSYEKIDIYDFNNDSKLDILASGPGGMTYLKNNANGTFAASYTIAGTSAFTADDFNNDGYLDIVSISIFNPATYAVSRNNTNNTFSTTINALTYTVGSITSGDFNNDGNKDLLVSRNSTLTVNLGYVDFLAGNGAFGFAAPVTVITSNPNTVEQIKSFDFNNDGISDLAACDASGTNGHIYLCNGSASFTQFKILPRGSVHSMLFKDINNDSYKDILTTNSTADNLNVMNGDAANSYSVITRYAVGYQPQTISVNDLNNDGINDVITGNNKYTYTSGEYSIILGTSSKMSAAAYFQAQPYTYNGYFSYTAADFNNDGLIDLALNGDSVKVYQNMGSGNFSLVFNQKYGAAPMQAIEAKDINKDGNVDIVCATFIASIWNLTVLRGNGNFTFQTPQHVNAGPLSQIKFFDMNNDLYPDVITNQGVFKNNGGLSYSAVPGMVSFSGGQGLDHGDFNGDGFEDIIYAGPGSAVCTELNTGGTGFAAPTTHTLCNSTIMGITVFDYNLDGKKDFAASHSNCTLPYLQVTIRSGNGNNTFNGSITTTVSSSGDLVAGDINLDGYPDIVNSDPFSNINLIINNKAGGFNSYSLKVLARNTKCVLADFNNDGALDISTGFNAFAESDISILYNKTPRISPNTNQTLCGSGNFYLKKLGAYPGYTWSPSGSSADSILINTSGFYSLTNTYTLNQCYCSVGINVNIIPTPTPNIFASNPVCPGVSQIMTVTGASSYTWNTGPTTSTLAISPTVTTTYTVTGQTSGCSGQSVKTITVHPKPPVTASTSNTMLCIGQSATLTANGANSYLWVPGGSGLSISVSPTITSTYTLIGTDVNTCTNSIAFTQSVSACTGIDEAVANPGLIIYPNPTSGVVIIKAKVGLQIHVYNIIGELILSTPLKTDTIELDLSNHANGIYFVRTGSATKKIIKE